MKAQNLAAQTPAQPMADVALPQLGAFGEFACQFRSLSASVHVDRTQAVFPSQKGAAQSTPPENKWSRGCRALKLPYWRFAWPLSWQVALRKPKTWFTWTNRLSPPSRPTPANTSKTKGRALLGLTARPALFLSVAKAYGPSATTVLSRANRFALDPTSTYGAGVVNDAIWSIPCVPQPSSPSSRLAPSLLALKKKLLWSLRRRQFPLSRPRPANTNKILRRGFGPAFAFTSALEVVSC